MKTIKLFLTILILALSVNTLSAQDNSKVITAEFQGFDEDLNMIFQDSDENLIIFHNMNYDIEIEISEDYIGQSFKITYLEEEITFDEDEEGEDYINRTIIKLEAL